MDEEEKKKLIAFMLSSGITSDDVIKFEKNSELPLSRIRNTSWKQLVENPVTMLQLSMPHKEKQDLTEWHVRNGEADLLIRSGKIKNKDGFFESTGLPSSWFPRYMLLWIVYTVQKTNNRDIFIGHTEAQILSKLDRGRHKSNYAHLRNQMPALFNCDLVINKDFPVMDIGDEDRLPFQGNADVTEYQRFIGSVYKFENKNKTTGSDKNDRGYNIYLTDGFYNNIIHNPLPIDFEHVKELVKGGGSYRLDIYTFLAERLYKIPEGKPLLIERQDIEDLFGVGTENKGQYYLETFKDNLKSVLEVYTTAKVEFSKKDGITLHHSPPPYPLEKIKSTSQLPDSSNEF